MFDTTGAFQGTGDFDPGASTFSLSFGGIFVSKLDNAGNFVWAKKLADNGSYGEAIAVDAVGNIFTTGRYISGDFDPGPGSVNLNAIGFSDIFISQLDPSGNYLWVGTAGDIGTDNAFSINVNNNAVHITGHYNVAGDFDPTAGTFSLTPVGGYDSYVMKLNIAATGIIESNNNFNSISIYPNPTTGEFSLKFNDEVKGDKQLTMFDINGKEILKQTIQAGVKQTELEIKTPGLYFINLETEEGKKLTRKVVVQ
ncbi:MAG: T9SS type A sorting domain-containing protein [Sphingobacteriaceae bacterium]|nr:T9SS type A sorting domain-containing protein [Sphingobacteriaceae bacterium]